MPVSQPIAPAHNQAHQPQHLQALARANRVRLARAALKRAIAAGERSVSEVILESPWEAESMSISELLSSQRRWGRTRSRKLILSLGLTENKRIGSLTHRQRLMLVAALESKYGHGHAEAGLGGGAMRPAFSGTVLAA